MFDNVDPRASISARLFWAVVLPAWILIVVVGGSAYAVALGKVKSSLHRELIATVTVGASTINPLVASFLLAGDEDTRSYKNLQRRLKRLQTTTGSARAMVLGADEKVRVDADGVIPIAAEAPRIALDRIEFGKALAGVATVSVPFTTVDGRTFMAAYARIPDDDIRDDGANAEDAPVLVLALEAPAEALSATEEVGFRVLFICLVLMSLVLFLAIVVARTISKPLSRLATEADRLVNEGLEKPLAVTSGRDEIASLARTLESMRVGLKNRDAERQMMLAGIAHEVRNPLGGMEIFAGLIAEGIDELPLVVDEKNQNVVTSTKRDLQSHIARVIRELHYLKRVVNDFLAYARDVPLTLEDVRILDLFQEVQSLKSADGRAEIVVASDAPQPIKFDRNRIKEALLNLVENALLSTSPEKRVSLRASTDDIAYLTIVVEDEGTGIPREKLEHIFTPFFTTREKGSGLGLPLVQKFVRQHGGDVSVESEIGRGTKVTMRISLSLGAGPKRSAPLGSTRQIGARAQGTAIPGEEAMLGDGD